MALVKVLSIPGKVAKMADRVAFEMCERFPEMYKLVEPPKVTVEILKEHIVTNGLPKKKEDVVEVKETIQPEAKDEVLTPVENKPEQNQAEMSKHILKKRKRKRKTKK